MSKRKLTTQQKKCVCYPEECEILSLSPKLNDFRLNGILCDGVINCADDKQVKVHRAIVSSVSPYFKMVFINRLNTTEGEKTETRVGISSYFLNLLLDYAYTGNCTITSENVEELLIHADRYEVLGVRQLCCLYLIKQMNPKNCFHVLKFAKQYFCQGLEKKAKLYVRHNFAEIIENPEEFRKLNLKDVKNILKDDELNVREEKVVYKAIKSWIKHEPNTRIEHLSILLSCLRFYQKDNNKFLKKVLKWKWLSEDQQRSLQAMSTASATDINMNGTCSRPRFPYEVLFAVGGWGIGYPTSHIETYDIRADKWFPLRTADQSPRAYHGVCALNMLVYVIGGFDGSHHFSTVRCFDPMTKVWRERACMFQARCYVSVAILDDKIYALGGFNGMSRLSSVERYCPQRNQWEMVAPMNTQRSDASAVSYEGKIYIVGGIDGREILSSGEVYDPATNQWTFIKPMRSPRSGVSLVPYHGYLYAIGGFNGYVRLNTCERIDPIEMTGWEDVARMSVTRSNFATVVLDDAIFAIGGFNGGTTIPTVECYNIKKNEWREVTSMNISRSALSACVIAGLPNAKEFSYLYKTATWENKDNEEDQSSSSS